MAVDPPVLLPVPKRATFDGRLVATREPVVRVDPHGLPPQGYEITIGEDAVRIRAADEAGAQYARTTLAQLERADPGSLPAGSVRDWPDVPIRAVMLDISRDKVPTMETLYALVDRLAGWKVNQLQLYAEHTFAYPGHEDVWRDASPMTAAEVHALDAYCATRHVELVPNQNCLGHMGRWLRHARYAPLAMSPDGWTDPFGRRQKPSTIEPSNPQSRALVRELLGELLTHFSSRRFVNVGLDEPWELPPERFDDYLAWMTTLRSLPEIDGREMLVWGDILAHHPDRIVEVPDGVTVCEWGYDAGHPFPERLAALGAASRPSWAAPGTSSWLSILGRVTNMREDCAGAATAARDAGSDGVLVTDWGDMGHLQYLPISEPGLAYGAAVAWGVESNRDVELARALDVHAFDDPSGELGAALLRLGDAHRLLGVQLPNMSSLVLHLYFPQLRVGGGTARVEELERVTAEVDDALAAVGRSASRRADAALVRDELANAAELVRILAVDASARSLGDGALESVSDATRAACAARLGGVVDEHARLWRARNRPGGLADSLGRLEHLRSCYETGITDPMWGDW